MKNEEKIMSIYQEIEGWVKQINAEVTSLRVLLDGEQDEIETVHLVIENSLEISGNLQMAGTFQAAETVSVGDLSGLVEKFSRRLKESADAVSKDFRKKVKGASATGDQGLQGETGGQGPTGDAGDQGVQGVRGGKGETGDTGRDRAARNHDFSHNAEHCQQPGCNTRNPHWRPEQPCRDGQGHWLSDCDVREN